MIPGVLTLITKKTSAKSHYFIIIHNVSQLVVTDAQHCRRKIKARRGGTGQRE